MSRTEQDGVATNLLVLYERDACYNLHQNTHYSEGFCGFLEPLQKVCCTIPQSFLPKNLHLRIHQTDNKHDNKTTHSTYDCIGLSLPPNCKHPQFDTELSAIWRRTETKEKAIHRQTRSMQVKCRFLPVCLSQ